MTIIAESQKLKDIIAQIDRIASILYTDRCSSSDTCVSQWQRGHVLISGETGVGKEVFGMYLAKQIVGPSFSEDTDVVIENCATLNNEIADSLLFGHEAGAFTGAVKQSRGLIETANGRILILDEIDKLSPPLQAKLLRFLETSKFKRLGGCSNILQSRCVVIAMGVNISLMAKDLYYRFAHRINIPPLRERREDIIPLFKQYLRRQDSVKVGKDIASILEAHSWPGNVREIRNLCDRLSIYDTVDAGTVFRLIDRPEDGNEIKESTLEGKTLEEIEKLAIVSALRKYSFIQQDAASALGITPRVMTYKLRQHGIKRANEDEFALAG